MQVQVVDSESKITLSTPYALPSALTFLAYTSLPPDVAQLLLQIWADRIVPYFTTNSLILFQWHWAVFLRLFPLQPHLLRAVYTLYYTKTPTDAVLTLLFGKIEPTPNVVYLKRIRDNTAQALITSLRASSSGLVQDYLGKIGAVPSPLAPFEIIHIGQSKRTVKERGRETSARKSRSPWAVAEGIAKAFRLERSIRAIFSVESVASRGLEHWNDVLTDGETRDFLEAVAIALFGHFTSNVAPAGINISSQLDSAIASSIAASIRPSATLALPSHLFTILGTAPGFLSTIPRNYSIVANNRAGRYMVDILEQLGTCIATPHPIADFVDFCDLQGDFESSPSDASHIKRFIERLIVSCSPPILLVTSARWFTALRVLIDNPETYTVFMATLNRGRPAAVCIGDKWILVVDGIVLAAITGNGWKLEMRLKAERAIALATLIGYRCTLIQGLDSITRIIDKSMADLGASDFDANIQYWIDSQRRSAATLQRRDRSQFLQENPAATEAEFQISFRSRSTLRRAAIRSLSIEANALLQHTNNLTVQLVQAAGVRTSIRYSSSAAFWSNVYAQLEGRLVTGKDGEIITFTKNGARIECNLLVHDLSRNTIIPYSSNAANNTWRVTVQGDLKSEFMHLKGGKATLGQEPRTMTARITVIWNYERPITLSSFTWTAPTTPRRLPHIALCDSNSMRLQLTPSTGSRNATAADFDLLKRDPVNDAAVTALEKNVILLKLQSVN